MIFALYDYFNYWFQRRTYSRTSIERDGGRLASADLFDLLTQAKPADSMFYHRQNSILSWFVMYYTGSVWSHVAVFTENGNLYDATTGGFIKHHFSDYLDGKGYITLLRPKVPLTPNQIAAANAWAESQLGAGFDWWGVIRFGCAIIFGSHPSYRFRFTADFLVLGLALFPMGFWKPILGWADVLAMASYCIVVLLNRPRRIELARLMFPESGNGSADSVSTKG